MIHLIMVLSAIMLSSSSNGELSTHSPNIHPSTTSSVDLKRTDEIKDEFLVDKVANEPLFTETLYGELAETSISTQYPATKMRKKKKGYKSRGLHSSQPYVTKPFRQRKILHQQDTRMMEDGEETIQDMSIRESVSSQPSLITRQQSPTKLTLAEPTLPEKQIVCKNDTYDIGTAADFIFGRDNKENNILNINATDNEVYILRNNNMIFSGSDEFVGSKISNGELPGHNGKIDRKTYGSSSVYRRDRVKRNIKNERHKEKKRNRTVPDHEESVEVNNSFSVDHNTTAENDTQTEDEFPETVNITANGNSTTAASANATSSSRGQRRRRGRRRQHRQSKDLALWIDERQVKLFSGYIMEIFAIHDGRVLPYILDPNFEKHLPVIPYEVQSVNFTWQAGRKRYYYTFDRLHSHDKSILHDPVVSLPTQGRIPRKPKVFTVNINCTGNASGIAAFDIGLLIQTRRGKPLPGTPLRLKLRKECTQPSPDPECDEKCENGGICDAGRRCQCPEGYMGQYCKTALCYPQCMNGGTCTTPGRCTCPPGYQGRHCEGGICRDKCENGGKCIQKDTCACPRGYYGNRCEFSKCVIPCINGGRCRNVNKCRCPPGFAGDHCEIVTGRSLATTAVARCSKKCRHGSCKGTTCQCQTGFTGRWCRRRGGSRKPVWL